MYILLVLCLCFITIIILLLLLLSVYLCYILYHIIYVYHIPLKARVLPSTLPKLLAASVHEVNSVEAPTTWMLLRIFRNNLLSGLAVGLCRIHGDQLVLRIIYIYIHVCNYIYVCVCVL